MWMEEILHQFVPIGNYETLKDMELYTVHSRKSHVPTGAGFCSIHSLSVMGIS